MFLCFRDISVILLGRTSVQADLLSLAMPTPQIHWSSVAGGLSDWLSPVGTPGPGYFAQPNQLCCWSTRAEQGSSLSFHSSHSEHGKKSAEPQLISSADSELTYYGELESFCSDLHTVIIWGQEYFSSLNNKELNRCMRSSFSVVFFF